MNACTTEHPITARGTGSRIGSVLTLVLLTGGLPCLAQPADSGDDHPPGYAATYRVDDDLLRTQRQPVILPSEPVNSPDAERPLITSAIGPVTPDQKRLPEGFIIAGRTATVRKDNRWTMVELEPGRGLPDAPPLRLLPNYERGLLEAVIEQSPPPHRFTITGRVTDFQGSNYLLLEHVAQAAVEEPPAEPTASEPAPSLDAESIAQRLAAGMPQAPNLVGDTEPGKATSPPDPAEPAVPEAEPTAEDVMQQLLRNRPLKPLVLPDEVVEEMTTPPDAAASPETRSATVAGRAQPPLSAEPAWKAESVVVNRAGRVLPSEDGWNFVFEDQGREPNRPPIRLLPNQLLENALALSGAGTRSVVFTVSGDVTVYRQQEYLLLRKVLVRRDMGNLR